MKEMQMKSFEVEKDRENSIEASCPLDKVDFVNRDAIDEPSSLRNTFLERDVLVDLSINHRLESDATESQCNLELKCSQTRKEKKRNRKMESPKKVDAPIDFQGDASTIKDSTIRPNSCDDCAVDDDAKTYSKIAPLPVLSRSQKRRMRKKKKQKLDTSVSIDEAYGSHAELDPIPEENDLISEKQSDSRSSPSSMASKHDNRGDTALYLVDQNSDSDELHSIELSDNEVKRVQAGEPAASVKLLEDVMAGKNTYNCSNVDFKCSESKDLILLRKDAGLDLIEDHNVQQLSHPLVGAHVRCADKKLLILDVNGLLADIVPYCLSSYKADIIISRKSVFKRPFCDDFLQFCFEKFNVGVWSSRTKKNVDMVIDFLMGDYRNKLLFVWHQSHCTSTGFTTLENSDKPLVLKELRKLWDKLVPDLPWNKGEYNESNTLLLDDSPYKALRNPANTAIFPHSYQYKDVKDCSLGPGGDLRVYLEGLAEAPNVQEYVAQNPFGQRAITESNPSWGFYQKILRVESCESEEVASSYGPSGTENL